MPKRDSYYLKRNSYYLKDKKAMIYKKRNVAEPGGMPEDKYVPIAYNPLWCYTSQLSQDRIYAAMAAGADENRYFVFNHLDGVEVDDSLKYNGKWYTITRVDTENDYNGETYIYCNDMYSPPADSDVLPEPIE